MHFQRALTLGSLAMLLAVIAAAPPVAMAHERRTLGGGKYDVVVGWEVEPAYVGEKNAASIRISRSGTNPAEPVLGVDKTLTVSIRQGAQNRRFDLRTVFGQPGYYVADILPTRGGDYTWTFNGTIGEDKIDETFDTADGKFNAVQAASGVEFPVASPDPIQLSADVQSARSTAESAQRFGLLGLGAGVLGLLVAVAMWLSRPRRVKL